MDACHVVVRVGFVQEVLVGFVFIFRHLWDPGVGYEVLFYFNWDNALKDIIIVEGFFFGI